MKTIRFYFDPISPYAALAFWRLPEVLAGRSYAVDYLPILFGALLKANASKGPAEIPAKRDWTYRQVLWLARQQGVDLRLPAAHPFNPLALLRLAWACAPEGLTPSRWVVERLFDHVWRAEGADPNDPGRLAQLAQQLAPQRVADEAAGQAAPARSHRRRAGGRRVRRADLRGGRQAHLGPGQPAHAGGAARRRPLVRRARLGGRAFGAGGRGARLSLSGR
jgi:2-hydroxychromene-2-carboxylate isomerase